MFEKGVSEFWTGKKVRKKYSYTTKEMSGNTMTFPRKKYNISTNMAAEKFNIWNFWKY